MQSNRFEYLLPDFISGSLDAESAQAVQQRIDTDPEFRRTYMRMLQTMAYLNEDKANEASPVELANMLVAINNRLDKQKLSFPEWIKRPRAFVPLALALQVVTVFALLSVYGPDRTAPLLDSPAFVESIQESDFAELADMQNELAQTMLLPSLPVQTNGIAVANDIATDFDSALDEQMFSELSYEDVHAAGGRYLSDEDLLLSLPEQTINKVLEEVRNKTIL